jgi:hypothetical protein
MDPPGFDTPKTGREDLPMVSRAGKIRAIFLAAVLAAAASVCGLTNQASANTAAQANASQIVSDMGAGWKPAGSQRQRIPQ